MSNKIAILTNFQDFNPGYSLTGIVYDQVTMLERFGNDVTVFVNERFNPKHLIQSGKKITVREEVPFGHLKDYKSVNKMSEDSIEHQGKIEEFLLSKLPEFDVVFTHDWVFTGWNMPYALAMQNVAREESLQEIRWFHWIHSIPHGNRDWWNIRRYGPKHRLVFPNKTERIRVAESYRGETHHVVCIPHIKDLRSFFNFHEDTCAFIDDFPSVMQADIVNVYPASTDRLEAKRLDKVIYIMSLIKNMGYKVSLVCANQWATGRQRAEDIERYYKMANRNGLRRNEDFRFTSDFDERFATGIPQRMLRELLLCANLFIFPTREESFGLVGPEAGLAGGKLMVLNKSLQMMQEVNGMTGIYVDFGSHHINHEMEDEASYFDSIAKIILGRMRENDALQSATFYRQSYNYDHLYTRHYGPAIEDSLMW